MKNAKIIAGILMVFILGLIIGAMGMRLHVKHRFDRFLAAGSPPRIFPRLMAHLDRELKLDPAQKKAVETITADLSRELFAIRMKLKPEIERTIDAHMDKMNDILNPDQQKRLEKFREKMKKRILRPRFERHHDRDHRPHAPPPPGPPPTVPDENGNTRQGTGNAR